MCSRPLQAINNYSYRFKLQTLLGGTVEGDAETLASARHDLIKMARRLRETSHGKQAHRRYQDSMAGACDARVYARLNEEGATGLTGRTPCPS